METSKLTKYYGKAAAVDSLDLQVDEGEVFGLLGPNGAGKTTTIKMLATLLAPTSGTAVVNGFDVLKSPSKVRESIGIVFQEPSTDELLSAYENLKMHSIIYGIPSSDAERRIDDALALVELTDRRNDLVKTFSGGMRRRLEIARGLLHRPKVLFLDEPTLGLDPRGRETMWKYVEQVVKELNMTILLTTHYMEEADMLADRVCIIDHGKSMAIAPPSELKLSIGGDLVTLSSNSLDVPALKKLDFVRKIEKKDGLFLITVDCAAKNLPALLRAAGQVDCVEVRRPTLGDVFLKFTGRGFERSGQGEEAEGGWFDKIVQQSVNKA